MNRVLIMSVLTTTLVSCGGNGESKQNMAEAATGDMESYVQSDVAAIEQSRPEIMVMPGDAILQDAGCLKTKKIDGEKFQVRDFDKFILADENFKPIVIAIQDKFKDNGYPLNDFEATLKSLKTQQATDIADNLAQDAKTQLLATAHPDIILELEYTAKGDMQSDNFRMKKISYSIKGIDAYTNKQIASASNDGLESEDVANAIANDLQNTMPKLMNNLQNYFSDLLTRGRDITVRINMDADSNQKLTDESIEGDSYADEIVDYIKTHTVKGAYKLQTNTADQLTFTNVRIKLLNDDGTQYGVYDWTRDLQKYLKKNLGISSENRSQGLGEVVLTIKGIE